MTYISNKFCMFSVALIVEVVSASVLAAVVTYPGPSGVPQATDRAVQVNGQELFVYDTKVNLNRESMSHPPTTTTPFAYFDFSGEVTVRVTAPGTTISSVDIRPKSLGIIPSIAGSSLTFTLNKPCKLSIEINNSIERVLHLFANEIEQGAPAPGTPGVHYFGPGVHTVGLYEVGDGQTVYVAGGAVVNGCINVNNSHSGSIRGRGIITGRIYDRYSSDWWRCNIIMWQSSNIDVRGVILLDPPGWGMAIRLCSNITLDDVKYIGARENSDGISIQSSSHVNVKDCFVRGWDDNIAIKAYDPQYSEHITVSNCVFWTDLAQAMEIGYETQADIIQDVLFIDCDVVHSFHNAVLSIHNGDRATVRDIRFEDIRVEDAHQKLVELRVSYNSQWNVDPSRGRIQNVYFKNISVTGGAFPPSNIQGWDAAHLVENVTFEGLRIHEQEILSAGQGQFSISQAGNIQFIPGQAPPARYTLTVNGGTGDGDYEEGTVASILADSSPAGFVFDKWTGATGGLADVRSQQTTITIPGSNAAVTATYRQATTYMPAGSTWKYNDSGVDLGTVWQAVSFNDGSWSSGAAELGYGDGAENTVVGYGSESTNKYVTTYFRKTFVISSASAVTSLTVKLLRDDGAVVHLNGVELLRDNMPAGTVNYQTVAATAVTGSNESFYFEFPVSTSALQDGTNVLAVEIHQNSRGSSDLSFDLELLGLERVIPRYMLTVNSGSGDGSYTSGTPVTITADQPLPGYVFDKWTGATNGVADASAAATTITMPTQDVIITATYRLPFAAGPFTAYNDLGWKTGEISGRITLYDGVSNTAGLLVDYASGTQLTVSVEITAENATNLKLASRTNTNPQAGSDACVTFNGIVDCDTYTTWDQGAMKIFFSNLSPTNRYTFVLFGNRADPTYTSRWTDVVISDVTSFTNLSSAGAIVSTADPLLPGDRTRLTAANSNGLVWKYDRIAPGSDGDILFTLTGSGTGSYINAFMLEGSSNGAGDKDADKDGLPDSWEVKHFGSMTNSDGGTTDDRDDDGSRDQDEYIAGTDPTNAASRFTIQVADSNNTVVVRFMGIPATGTGYSGAQRYYDLEESSNLVTAAWRKVAGCTNLRGDGVMLYLPCTNSGTSHYRARARLAR